MRVYWHDEALVHDTGEGMFDQGPTPLIEAAADDEADDVSNAEAVTMDAGPPTDEP